MDNKIEHCQICKQTETFKVSQLNDGFVFKCRICGEFYVTGTALSMLGNRADSESKQYILWSITRQADLKGQRIDFNSSNIDLLIESANPPENPLEQMDLLLNYILHKTHHGGEEVRFEFNRDYPIIWARNEQEIKFVIAMLIERGLINGKPSPPSSSVNGRYYLTANGWERCEELSMKGVYSRRVFMAMKFNDTELEDLYEKSFKKAVEATGFELRKLNEGSEAGLLDPQMEVRIRNSRFMIADLTHDNSGVYWEAGFATGLNKPVIYTCRFDKTDIIHWDTNHRKYIPWNPDNPTQAVEELKSVIRATLPTEARMED